MNRDEANIRVLLLFTLPQTQRRVCPTCSVRHHVTLCAIRFSNKKHVSMKKIMMLPALLLAMMGTAQTNNTLTAAEKKAGWQLLFDGSTSKGWRGFNKPAFPAGWVVEAGTLKTLGTAHGDTGGDIVYGDAQFEHFELYLEWKISPGGNSGIFYHAQEGSQYKAPYQTAPEYQLIDDTGYPDKLEDWQTTACDYAMYTAPADKALKPAGEWNTARIIVTAKKVEYWLNGKMTVSFVPGSDDWWKRRNSGKWESFPDYGKFSTGFIALQDHGSPTWFRNIKIRKL